MKCEKCGSELNSSSMCPNCGQHNTNESVIPVLPTESSNLNVTQCDNTNVSVGNNSAPETNKVGRGNLSKSILNFIKEKKLIFIILGIIILITIIVLLFFGNKDRKEVISTIEINSKLKFTIDEKEYHLGEKVSDLIQKDLYYESTNDENYVLSDSIALESFYFDKKVKFLGAIYCGEEKKCSYDDSILLKANFYGKTDVVVDDFIKIGTKYDDIVEKYGEENGAFYQNNDFLVWSFGKKMGDPYYLLKFDKSSIISSNTVSEIRIGIWWYDGEYEHTVVKGEGSEK